MGIIFIIVYALTFRPVKRPNYSLLAGEYSLEKMKETLYRKEFYYSAGQSVLKGYFYPNKESNQLIVICHGFRSGADDFLPLIKELNKLGFNVFSYDVTATYDSKGKSLIGMCQWLVDLDNTLKYLKSSKEFSRFSIYLVGHSLGGYAVLSVLNLHKDICGCVAIAPVSDAYTLMMETAKAKVGNYVTISKPFFNIVQRVRFGKYVNYNAINGINSVNIPVLVVQGDNDKVISIGNVSVLSRKKEIVNPNVRFIKTVGLNGGHSSVWHSKKSVEYKNKVDKGYKFYKKALKNKDYRYKKQYFSGVNNYLYSQPSQDLVRQIKRIFLQESV